jgi:hypothetical protein
VAVFTGEWPVASEWDSVWETFCFDGRWGAGVWRRWDYDGVRWCEGSGRLGCEWLGWWCKRADHLPKGGLGKTFEKDARRRHAWSRASDCGAAQQFARFTAPAAMALAVRASEMCSASARELESALADRCRVIGLYLE